MRASAQSRLVIPHHGRQDAALTGVNWGLSGETLRVGVVDRELDRDVCLPSKAVAPHLSLVLLLEGQGHFLMGGATRPCQFMPGHGLLSCGWEPFDGEDFLPAHTRFRAVLFHFPLALRRVLGPRPPLARADCEVHAHPGAQAWLARLPLPAWMRALGQQVLEQGLPSEPLALLDLHWQGLRALHALAATLREGAPPARDAVSPEPQEPAGGEGLSGRDRRRLLEARRYIDARLDQPLSVAEIAAAAGMNETALKTGFRRFFGSSVYDYVLRCRCGQAARLLRSTALPVREVAARSGFASPSHLARHFRARYGASPLQYRQRH